MQVPKDGANGSDIKDLPEVATNVTTKLDAILATLVKLNANVDSVASDLNLQRADQNKGKGERS